MDRFFKVRELRLMFDQELQGWFWVDLAQRKVSFPYTSRALAEDARTEYKIKWEPGEENATS